MARSKKLILACILVPVGLASVWVGYEAGIAGFLNGLGNGATMLCFGLLCLVPTIGLSAWSIARVRGDH